MTRQFQAETYGAELAIIRLVQQYAVAADRLDRSAFAQCFTQNGTFDRLGSLFKGQDEISGAISIPPGVKRRHFFSSPIVHFLSETTAQGSGYCLLVQHDDVAGALKPLVAVDYEDVYALTAEGWRLASRSVRPSF